MKEGSLIRDRSTGKLGIIIEVRHANVIGIEKLPLFCIMWQNQEATEDIIGQQLLSERYEFVTQIKADI
jgi:hypothetical protein